MNLEIGTFSKGSTGNTTILLNNAGIPDELEFIVSEEGSSDSQNHKSVGSVNSNLDMEYTSTNSSGSNHKTESGTGKVIKHYKWSGSAWVLKLEATVTAIDDGEFDMNFTQADGNYSITVKSRVS